MEMREEAQRASLASKERKARWALEQITPSTPPEEAVGCHMSETLSHRGLPRVKSLSSHPDISITASSTAARALLSVFCKGLFKNVETNIPQELNISPRGEEKSYKNIYHSAQGQGRGKSETEQGSRREDGGEEWEPQHNETEWRRENKRGVGRAKQQEGRDNREGDRGTGQEWEVGKQWEREDNRKKGVESQQSVKEGGPPLRSCQGRARTTVRHQRGCNQGAGVWPKAFVLQDSALRLCHSLIQSSLKVIVFENLRGMNKLLLSKYFSLSGKGVGNEGTRFARALRCH